MSVKRSLAAYLLDRSTLTGEAARKFIGPQRIDGVDHYDRNDARQSIQRKIGDRIYFDRRPAGVLDHASITMQTVDHTPDYGLAGEDVSATELLTLTVYARGGDAAKRAENIGDLLQLAVSGYAGDLWGTARIDECLVESQLSNATPPADATDQYTFERRIDLQVTYEQVGAPVFPATPLTPIITWVLDPGAGSELRLSSDASLIPEGQTVSLVQWDLRPGGSGSPVAISISGAPNAAVGAGPITGTFANPGFDRVAFGLTGLVHITLILTVNAATATVTDERVE